MYWAFKERSIVPGDWNWEAEPTTWRFKERSTTPGDWNWRIGPPAVGGGRYSLYLGATPATIDWNTSIADFLPGLAAGQIALAMAPDTDYWFGLRAQSAAGVEEDGTRCITCVRIDQAGNLVGPPPNALASGDIRAVAGGKIEIAFAYNANGELGQARSIQIAFVTDGLADWSPPLASVAVYGSARKTVIPDQVFTHGQSVELAIRAVTALGRAGPELLLEPVTADAVGPSAVDGVTIRQRA